jgi:hypothetical protein
MTQKQANELMEDCKYSLGKRYAEIIESVWFTYLYATLIPLGGFLIFLGIGIFYWIDKLALVRRSSINENVAGQLCLQALKLLDFTLILKPAGELIFDSQIRDDITYESIVCICVGFVYILLPIDLILDFVHSEKFNLE